MNDQTLMGELAKRYDLDNAIRHVGGLRKEPLLMLPNHPTDLLIGGVNQLMDQVPAIQWKSSTQTALSAISLTCRKDSDDPDYDCCGSHYYKKYCATDYYHAPMNDTSEFVKGGYMDGLQFNSMTPKVMSIPSLAQYFKGFKVPVVRSTVRTIDCGNAPLVTPDGGFHTDGNPFQYLRINVCLTAVMGAGLQYIGEPPFYMVPGENRVIMSHIPHRAYILDNYPGYRTHAVIDVVPWFSFDGDTWVPNEFFGVKHPFDMVNDGDIYV